MTEIYKDVSMDMLDEPKGPVSQPSKIVGHFRKPMKEGSSLLVDEAYALQYADLKAESKIVEKNLEIMNKALKGARMGHEANLAIGKALVVFKDIEDQSGVDWQAMFLALNGEPDAELKAQYTKITRKGYTTVEVKVIDTKA